MKRPIGCLAIMIAILAFWAAFIFGALRMELPALGALSIMGICVIVIMVIEKTEKYPL